MGSENYLCYVNYVGTNYRGLNIYEFIFTDDIKKIDGENWNMIPSNSNPEPPTENIVEVGVLYTDIELILIQDSDGFGIRDAKHKIIPIAWEDISDLDEDDIEVEYNRMYFMFGENMEVINDKLYSKDLELKYQIK